MDDVLTQSETERMLKAVRSRAHRAGKPYRHAERDALILRLMLEVGLRASELVALRFEDIASDSLSIRGARERRVACPADLARAVFAAIDNPGTPRSPQDCVFPLSTRAVRELVADYARRADIVREIRPQTLRRTFAQRAIGTIVRDVEGLKVHLGLESIEAAARYLTHDLVGAPMRAAS